MGVSCSVPALLGVSCASSVEGSTEDVKAYVLSVITEWWHSTCTVLYCTVHMCDVYLLSEV